MPVNIGLQNIRHVVDGRVVHNEYGLEQVHNLCQIQDKYGNDGICQCRHGNVTHSVKAVRAVDLRRLIEIRADTGQCCKEQNGSPTGILPDVYHVVNPTPVGLCCQELNRLCNQTHIDQCLIHHSRIGSRKHHLKDGSYNNPRHKVRQIDDCLHCLLEMDLTHFIQQQGNHNSHSGVEDQLYNREHQCIAKSIHKLLARQSGKLRQSEHIYKVLDSDILRLRTGYIIREGISQSRHREVIEQNEEKKHRQEHYIEPSVVIHSLPYGLVSGILEIKLTVLPLPLCRILIDIQKRTHSAHDRANNDDSARNAILHARRAVTVTDIIICNPIYNTGSCRRCNGNFFEFKRAQNN